MEIAKDAFLRAADGRDLATVRAYMDQAHVAAEARRVESFLASEGRGVLRSNGRAREAADAEIQRRRAWFLRHEYYSPATVFQVADVPRVDMLEGFYGHDALPIAASLPFTLGYLFHDLLIASVRKKLVVGMEVLLTSTVFGEFLSAEEREWNLATAATLLGPHGTDDTINYLLAHGADVNGGRFDTHTPIFRSSEPRGFPTLRPLVSNGVFTVGLTGVLARAAGSLTKTAEGHVSELIRLGVDVHAPSDCALHIATANKRPQLVQALLNRGFADIDARDEFGRTPLMRAVREFDSVDFTEFETAKGLQAIRALIKFGAHLDLQDNEGRTALSLAPIRHHCYVLRELLKQGANPNLPDAKGLSPLHHVSDWTEYSFEAIRTLLEYGADVNATAQNGKTPLHTVLESSPFPKPAKFASGVELLLQHGANPNAPDSIGRTPLHLALRRHGSRDDAIVQTLIKHGADLDQPDNHGVVCRQMLPCLQFPHNM